jgi:hypothetical protein
MQPRLIRLRDAPAYLGIDRNRFNNDVRPTLMEVPIGEQGVAFDRLDLDAWVDHYIQRNGRPAQGRSVWDRKECQDSPKEVVSGTLTKLSTEVGFAKALVVVGLKKQNVTSPSG